MRLRDRISRRPVRRIRRRTLLTRLTAGLVLLLLAACVAVGLATTLALRGFLVSRLDEQLHAAGSRFAISVEHAEQSPSVSGAPESAPGLTDVAGQSVGTLGARVVAGKVTEAAIVRGDRDQDRDDEARLTSADRSTLAAVPPGNPPRTVHLKLLGDYRVIAARGRDGDVLLTGLPLRPVHDTLERLELVEVIVFAAVLLATGLTGAAFVRLSLRPLRRVATTALTVSKLPLASGEVALPDRVPDADPQSEVGQLGSAVNSMLDHVETALAARHRTEDRLREFVADASHELRTPLAGIRAHAELARRFPEALPERIAHALGRIEAEADRMGHLVDDLLLLARLDAGRPLAREPVDLTRLAIDAISDARAAGPRHRWQLDLPEQPVVVRGDGHRLHQVVANLLANARTHTPPASTVTVQVRGPAETGASASDGAAQIAEVAVSDDGPGIAPAVQEAMFERFVRADASRSRDAGGTGLGLSIVAAVVRAHHGTVTVESRPGHTTFRVRLPVEPA